MELVVLLAALHMYIAAMWSFSALTDFVYRYRGAVYRVLRQRYAAATLLYLLGLGVLVVLGIRSTGTGHASGEGSALLIRTLFSLLIDLLSRLGGAVIVAAVLSSMTIPIYVLIEWVRGREASAEETLELWFSVVGVALLFYAFVLIGSAQQTILGTDTRMPILVNMATVGMIIVAAFGSLYIALVTLPHTGTPPGIYRTTAALGMLILFTTLSSLALITLAEAPPFLPLSICVAALAYIIAVSISIREAERIREEMGESS